MKCETNFRTIGGGFANFSHPLASPHHPKIPPEWVKTQILGYLSGSIIAGKEV
jgi:hypothetical protein